MGSHNVGVNGGGCFMGVIQILWDVGPKYPKGDAAPHPPWSGTPVARRPDSSRERDATPLTQHRLSEAGPQGESLNWQLSAAP